MATILFFSCIAVLHISLSIVDIDLSWLRREPIYTVTFYQLDFISYPTTQNNNGLPWTSLRTKSGVSDEGIVPSSILLTTKTSRKFPAVLLLTSVHGSLSTGRYTERRNFFGWILKNNPHTWSIDCWKIILKTLWRGRSVLTGRYRVPNVSGEIADVSSFLGGLQSEITWAVAWKTFSKWDLVCVHP